MFSSIFMRVCKVAHTSVSWVTLGGELTWTESKPSPTLSGRSRSPNSDKRVFIRKMGGQKSWFKTSAPFCNDRIVEPLREALAKLASATVAEFAQVIIDRYWQEFRRKNQDQRHLPRR